MVGGDGVHGLNIAIPLLQMHHLSRSPESGHKLQFAPCLQQGL